MAGASTAWVQSPIAATLHSIPYHRVDVHSRQVQLAMRQPTQMSAILEPPLIKDRLARGSILQELRENAHSILKYVVRWCDHGSGTSSLPNLQNVSVMEDRSTLRVSSQLLANWLQHGLTNETELRAVFSDMAKVVDNQNMVDRTYRPMVANLDTNIAFQTALKLVLDGCKAPNGYTEYVLHEARRRVKANDARARL